MQLAFYIFIVLILATGKSVMYTYQTITKKGSGDVASTGNVKPFL